MVQLYQEGSSFFQQVSDYIFNYFGSVFEDIITLTVHLPKQIQNEISSVLSVSSVEILHLRGALISEFAALGKEINDIPASVCKKLPFCS
jgi:hypothetical protein